MTALWTRRRFVLASATAGSAAVLGRSFYPSRSVLAATFTRRDVGGLTASDPIIKSYAKAVTAMQALPASDPRSWTYQAGIHGSLSPCPCPTSWNSCEHGTKYFWSWHRMYLYYFEQIVRHMSGDSGWALPYWNWQLATESHLPPMFRDPASSLYTAHRNASINSGAGSLPPGDVDCSTALGDLAYDSSVLDIQNPHGNVHVNVGGWMGSVPTSAQDPIFYLHHSNVDRLWNIWLAQGGGRTDPLTDAAWKAKTYTFFDGNGTAVTMKDCDVLRAAQQLNYGYEGEPAQVNEYCTVRIKIPWWEQLIPIWRSPIPPVEIISDPVSIPVELGQGIDKLKVFAGNSQQRVYLVLDGVEATHAPGVTFQVYLGPLDAARDQKGSSYIGTFSLFGAGIRDEAHHGFTPARFRFLVKRPSLAALTTGAKLALTIVPSGILVDGRPARAASNSPLHIGSVQLVGGTETEGRAPGPALPSP